MSFLPLAGIRVVDLTSSVAGPYCAAILGALGADVVKVEHPVRGDESRSWGPPFWNGEGVMFLSANPSKRSVALDVKEARGREVLLRLVGRGDVFVQSLRPGSAERLGLGADALRELNPRLVYCNVGAYGATGPLRDEPGYDALMQARAGLISVTGEADRPGVRVGASIVDQGTGSWAAIGILAALLERATTGVGRVVDVSLFETAVGYVPYHVAGYLASGVAPGRHGTEFPLVAPYRVYSARDGELLVSGSNDKLYRALCAALEREEWIDDPRFATNALRVEHRRELDALVGGRLAEERAATWLERFSRAGVPASPVQDIAQVAGDPQTRALGLLQALPHPRIPEQAIVAPSVSVDGERVLHRAPAPLLGQHTREVLAELGFDEEEIGALERDGVIRVPPS
ncbi:MAG: CoA:oxalate CoA-transferase [Gaiellaceae bacterium]|nr:CoA:oxalate CoA-transferase [Gaiellaceae bacterium]